MAKAKPGTPHPTKRGLVMGTKGRYVAKSTYNKQVKAAKTETSRPKVKAKAPAAKPAPKALPPKATTGGRRYSSGTASSRRAQAAAKQVRAAQGTKSSGVRTGQPAGAANRRFGADRVARSVRRAQVETAVRGAARRIGKAGPVAAGTIGMELAGKMAQTAGKPGQSRMSRLGIQGPAKPKVKSSPKAKPKAKSSQSTKSGMTPAQLKAAQDKANADRRAGKLSNIPAPKAKVKANPQTKKQQQTQTPKPKVKKGSGVERRLPKGKERKDRAYSAVEELRAMRERSKQRQGKKKKKQSRANQAGWQGNRNY